jgi:aspartate racemase
MKKIGLLGGMSWESTLEYYRVINQAVKERLGGLHSAKIILVSLDFDEVEQLQLAGDWDEATSLLASGAVDLQSAGADYFLICTNTMHLIADQIQDAVTIPLLHIADATARAVKNQGIQRVGLLGTKYTMEKDFYRGRLESKHQLQVLVPESNHRSLVHQIIFDELVLGQIRDESRLKYQEVIQSLEQAGAEGIILGCTEIGMLVHQEDWEIPIFDTMEIHALAAVEEALDHDPLS